MKKRALFTLFVLTVSLVLAQVPRRFPNGIRPATAETTDLNGGKTVAVQDANGILQKISVANLASALSISTGNLSQEEVEDILANLITSATHSGAAWTYDDAAGTLSLNTSASDTNDFPTGYTLVGKQLTLTIPNQTDVIIDLNSLFSDRVPYTGASSNLELGSNSLFANGVEALSYKIENSLNNASWRASTDGAASPTFRLQYATDALPNNHITYYTFANDGNPSANTDVITKLYFDNNLAISQLNPTFETVTIDEAAGGINSTSVLKIKNTNTASFTPASSTGGIWFDNSGHLKVSSYTSANNLGFNFSALTAGRTLIVPNKSGTIALLDDVFNTTSNYTLTAPWIFQDQVTLQHSLSFGLSDGIQRYARFTIGSAANEDLFQWDDVNTTNSMNVRFISDRFYFDPSGSGDSMYYDYGTENFGFGSDLPRSSGTPTFNDQLTTKIYVDNAIQAATAPLSQPSGGGSFDVNANYNLTGTWTWDERVRTDVAADSWGYLMDHNTRQSGIYNDANNDAQLVLRDANGNADVFLKADNTSEFTNEITIGGQEVVDTGDVDIIQETMLNFANEPVDGYRVEWDNSTNQFRWALPGTGLSNGANTLTDNLEFTIESVAGYGVLLDTTAVSVRVGDGVAGITADNGEVTLYGQSIADQEAGSAEAVASVGYVNSKLGIMTPVSFTGTDTLEVSHMNRIIQMNSANDSQIYWPSGVGEPGNFVIIYQKGLGKAEPVALAGTTFLTERRTAGQYQRITGIVDADGEISWDPEKGEAFTFAPPFSYPNQSNGNTEKVDDDAWSITNNTNSAPGVWTDNNQTVAAVADANNPAGVSYVLQYTGTADDNTSVNHLFNQIGSLTQNTTYNVDILYKFEQGPIDGEFQVTGGGVTLSLNGDGIADPNGWYVKSGSFVYSSTQQINFQASDDNDTGGVVPIMKVLMTIKQQ